MFRITYILLFFIIAGFAIPAFSEPPPWAPAHGYYKDKNKGKGNKYGNKHKGAYRSGSGAAVSYEMGPYLANGRCNRQATAQMVGTVVGGVLGSRVGGGDGKKIATILGAVVGYVVGGNIGRHMDDADQLCTGQVLEYGEDHRPVEWQNPDTSENYAVTPTRTYETDAGYCREFTTSATIEGHQQHTYGTACRQPDGSWKVVR